jgi:hypothetical protein
VDENIAERDDLCVVLNARSGRGVCCGKTFDSLTNDLEISLNGLPQHAVSGISLQRHADRDISNKLRGVAVVFKQLRRARMHRPGGVSDWPTR